MTVKMDDKIYDNRVEQHWYLKQQLKDFTNPNLEIGPSGKAKTMSCHF
jgi:hypothetical protein